MYPEEAPPAILLTFFASPLFFLVNFLTNDAEMKTKIHPAIDFA